MLYPPKRIRVGGLFAFFVASSDLPAEVPFTGRRRERSSSEMLFKRFSLRSLGVVGSGP